MKILTCLFMLLLSNSALACTICNSPTAVQIRTAVFGPHFFYNLGITILPFAIFAIIVLIIYKGSWLCQSTPTINEQ